MKKGLGEIEKHRLTSSECRKLGIDPLLGSNPKDGNNGMFRIPKWNKIFKVIVSDHAGWEHVSVSKDGRPSCPTWEEMCWVKSLFWDPEEVVMQIHPAESQNRSYHDYCLHLWRPVNIEIPLPDPIMIADI